MAVRDQRGRRRTAGSRARRTRARRRRGASASGAQSSARRSLRGFSKAGLLAIALTAFLLLVIGVDEGLGQETAPTEPPNGADRPDDLASEAAQQARETFESLWLGFVGSLPQIAVALLVLLLAWLVVRLIRPLVRRATGAFQKGPAISAMFGIVVWLLAVGIAVSVLAGDIRALLGSIGLIGLALSWALQAPIESFTGWLMNSFQGYYRVGDRIAVGEVYGDVARIDFLTTTVWEYGGSERLPTAVAAEQPTGRLITFPNNEILTGSIVNLTRDFPYVWDELAYPIAAESDLEYARDVIDGVAQELLAAAMEEPAEHYRRILDQAGLPQAVSTHPEVFVTLTESGVDLVVRYLVAARQRRIWQSRLALRLATEVARPEHAGRIVPLYPRRQIQMIDASGSPTDAGMPPGEEGG